ncbi:hypothetical protein IIB50_01185 [Patescibacteria group bacterium]|nr:hypothetical protein [Patescibacteria group bacterium]
MNNNSKRWKLLLQITFIGAVIALAFWAAQFAQENTAVQALISSYGYLAIFLVSIISGFNLVVPIPAVSFLPLFLESGLSLWVLLFTMTAGVTLADIIAYLVGKSGRQIAIMENHSKLFVKIDTLRAKYHSAPLFILFAFASIVPLPNEILVLPMGFIGYRLREIILPVLLGNGVFNTITAFGIISLFQVL